MRLTVTLENGFGAEEARADGSSGALLETKPWGARKTAQSREKSCTSVHLQQRPQPKPPDALKLGGLLVQLSQGKDAGPSSPCRDPSLAVGGPWGGTHSQRGSASRTIIHQFSLRLGTGVPSTGRRRLSEAPQSTLWTASHFIPPRTLSGGINYPIFTDEDTEAQTRGKTC